MEERLRYILSTVNEWLKFAEAKNGALLAADTAILFGIFKLASELSGLQACVSYFAIFLITSSAVSCLLSFIPKLKIPLLEFERKRGKEDSLIFYGHIARYDPQSYLEVLFAQSGVEPPTNSSIEIDYAKQIITNSRIALRKYRCFNIGLWLTVAALLVLLIVGLVFVTTTNR